MRHRLLALLSAALVSALPSIAGAQTAAATSTGPSLLMVWGWILVAGIIIFVAGTSFFSGTGSRK